MSEKDLTHLLERTVHRLQRSYYVLDFLLSSWDFLKPGTKRELFEMVRGDMANFLTPFEHWHIFEEMSEAGESER